jgi:hypothetical protein
MIPESKNAAVARALGEAFTVGEFEGIPITDFVEARPLAAGESGIAQLAATVRRVRELPPFPKLVNYLDSMDGYVRKFQAAKILPENETAEVASEFLREE